MGSLRHRGALLRVLGLVVVTVSWILAGACAGGRTPYIIEQYTLEYPAPKARGSNPMETTLRVERFSAAKAYSGQAMVCRSAPFKLDVYDGHRWRVPPGDMVTDFLLRDLRSAGVFQAVFSYHDPQETRFVLEGAVEEFLESEEQGGAQAVLALSVTLLDLGQREVTKRVVYQRRYRFAEPLQARGPLGLVQAMSRAMEMSSAALLDDMKAAVKDAIRP